MVAGRLVIKEDLATDRPISSRTMVHEIGGARARGVIKIEPSTLVPESDPPSLTKVAVPAVELSKNWVIPDEVPLTAPRLIKVLFKFPALALLKNSMFPIPRLILKGTGDKSLTDPRVVDYACAPEIEIDTGIAGHGVGACPRLEDHLIEVHAFPKEQVRFVRYRECGHVARIVGHRGWCPVSRCVPRVARRVEIPGGASGKRLAGDQPGVETENGEKPFHSPITAEST